MKLSKKALACGYSPMRKFHPYAVAAEQRGKTIYRLNIGQPDIKTPPAYRKVLHDYHEDVLAYAPSPGTPGLIAAVAEYYRKLGIALAPEDILITTGGSEALDILMKCILDDGDQVLTAEPFYPNYDTFIRAAGGTIVPVPTTPEENYRHALREKYEPLITPRTRAILFTNPGNPTGNVLTAQELRTLADIAKEHDLYLVADEVYREFIYSGEEMALAGSLADVADNVVIVDSVSKRFSACGARVGALISKNKALMAQAMKFCQGRLAVATIDQTVAEALYGVDSDYFHAIRDEYRRRRDICYRKLLEIPGVVCAEPQGAFYMMAKLPVDDTDAFQKWLLEEFEDNGETVMFAPGASFYATPGSGAQEVRIAYVLEEQKLERAMELLKIAIATYQTACKKENSGSKA